MLNRIGWGLGALAWFAAAPMGAGAEPAAPAVVSVLQAEGRSALPVSWLGRLVEEAEVTLTLYGDGSFALCDAFCLTGTWAPRGRSGHRFDLALDAAGRGALEASLSDAIEEEIHFQYAVLAQAAVALAEGHPPRIRLRVSRDGTRARLRVRALHHSYLLGDQVPPSANEPRRSRFRMRLEGVLLGAP